MKGLGQALILVASLAGSVSAAEPDDARWRAVLASIEPSIPSKPIKNVAIAPNKDTQGGDVVISFADGSTHRLEAQGYAQAAQHTPDGQTFGFNLVEYYIDTKGDLWIASRAIVLYRNGKRVSVIIPERQATVGWAFRGGGKSIAVSAQGTHGPTYLGLYEVATGKRLATADGFDEAPKPKWMQGEKLLFCCTVRTTTEAYRQ
ncbi:MAG: hypothetical protein JNM40_06810 [Myxococcales bacterium]|nr:hypothetical protein [Myxococcales bacterium]